ncbi:MAG: Na/Pi cotransporter family protein [Deltaproteobacteria bacterium]|nr:Na/Pi cotransporter family protein [Deltaproteobacteria bacterium]
MTNVIIQTLGGLGLFILGMSMMTDGLQMSAGDRIKKILSAVSSNRIIGCASGAGVTAIVQSSSATTVMLISFVGAGMMSLQQAVGVILGANIGTTVTAQMIAFKLGTAALPAITIGVVLKFFSKSRRQRYIGEVILGFGLLFFGMTVMKQGLAPIKGDPAFIDFFTRFDPGTLSGVLLCIATGAILTIMVQSSSATVGLTMTLATQGLLTFPAAMALVLGENIGTTITAELATIGSSNIDAHRAARAHTMFNVIGVGIMIALFPYFIEVVEMMTGILGAGSVNQIVDGDYVNVARYIANGHSIFNIINALIFLLFLPWLIKVAIFLSPKKEEEKDILRLPKFDHRFLDTTIAALARARSEVVRMADVAMEMFENTIQSFEQQDLKGLNRWRRYEQHLDAVQKEINTYLTKIFQGDVNQSEAKEISSLMRMTNNVERIGDSIENVALMVENIIESKMDFSQWAVADIKNISSQVVVFIKHVTEGMQHMTPSFMEQAQEIEDNIDFMREEMRQEHINRLRSNKCGTDAGLLFSDMLSNFEKMGDYCYNIAQAVAGIK